MAPTVPFALLGVVQLAAVSGWLGLAGISLLPRQRGRASIAAVAGAVCLAVADALVLLRFGVAGSQGIGLLRLVGLVLVAVAAWAGTGQSRVLVPGALPGIVVPLGAAPSLGWPAAGAAIAASIGFLNRSRKEYADRAAGSLLAAGMVLTAVSTATSGSARDSTNAALVVLAARAAATVALPVGEMLIARTLLVGKLVGAIVAGVVAMAIGAVAVVGTTVSSSVESEQSQRLLSVAQSQVTALSQLETRASINARILLLSPCKSESCESQLLKVFASTPAYFAVIYQPGHGVQQVATNGVTLSKAQLLALSGDSIVTSALARGATTRAVNAGPVVLPGQPDIVAIISALPGRPKSVQSVNVKPSYAAIYGIGLDSLYLQALSSQIGYGISVVADGGIVGSSLHGAALSQVEAEAQAAHLGTASATTSRVVPAEGNEPTAAFVPITATSNGDVRLATLVVSQDATAALAAQKTALQRLIIAALAVLLVVALLAVALARRIADPVRRLTVAAGRVRRGDLSATTTITSRDEVGALSRAFDSMTASLRGLTGELREAADEEAALRARLETVIGGMSDGLIATDIDGLITSANPTSLALLGLPESDVIGRKLTAVVDVRSSDDRKLLTADALRRGRDGVDANLMVPNADGVEKIPVRLAIAPLADGTGTVVTLGDRSREREVERLKTEFLANISHELRTPLTPIRGYAEILLRRKDLDRERIDTFATEIVTATVRMNRVVALLVDVAALDAGRVVPAHREQTVTSFVDSVLAGWRERFPERAGDFRRRLATGLPPVDIDAEWVSKAMGELADNAVKNTAVGSNITIRGELAEGRNGPVVRLIVADTGPGIPADRLPELLGDFSQVDASETRALGGLGLGLGFVRRVCDQFGLELVVHSTPGKGSEFCLDLPVASDRLRTGRHRRRQGAS